MSIQPIDLQTLFVKMNQVGKEQAAQKDAITVQQEIHGSEIVKKHQHDDSSVNRADTPDTGPEKAREDKEGSRQHKKGEGKNKQNEHQRDKEILRDPDLGKNIDFSG